MGVIPLRADLTCLFAVIDVDIKEFPDIDPAELARRIGKMKLQAVVCRSKSGGAHVYVFFKRPNPVHDVLEYVHALAAMLGFGGAEIFPKQETRTSDDDVGNWINIPYFGNPQYPRFALDDSGEPMELMTFLPFAESRQIIELSEIDIAPSDGLLFDDGPPCLQQIANAGGFPDGTRNEGMFSVGVYVQRRYPDNWESKMSELNGKMCSPALEPSNLVGLIRQLKKKSYQYKCKQAPLKPLCNKKQCLQRRYGVGESPENSGVEITHITKYPADPVIWCVEIGGHRLEMDTDSLLNHRIFTKMVAEKISKLPSVVNQAKWIDYLRPKIEAADEVPPPEEADAKIQFRLYLERWLTGSTQARSRDEMLLDKPFREGGKIFFLPESLKRKLDADRYKYKSMHEIWNLLKDIGAEHGKGVMMRNKFRRPWVIQDPDIAATGDDEFGSPETKVPF